MMDTIELGLDEIKVDFSTYGYRKQKDLLRVQQYREILDVLPPVDVFDTPLGMVLVAGHHRYDAHVNEGRQTLRANLHQGSELEARLFAIKSNVVHGLPLTRAERKQALRDFILISKAGDGNVSDREIARDFGACSRSTVLRERRELVKEELLPLNADELANLDGYIAEHSQMSDTEIADAFGCHSRTVYRHRQDLLKSGVLEPESSDSASNDAVSQNEENDDQGDLFQTGGSSEEGKSEESSSAGETGASNDGPEPEQEAESTSADAEAESSEQPEEEKLDQNSATSGEGSVPKTETTEESIGQSSKEPGSDNLRKNGGTSPQDSAQKTDLVASGNNTPTTTDPMAQFYKDKQKQVEYLKITSWVNEFIDDLTALNLKFNGLIREYKPGGISEALEKQNVEHRLNDIATECHWMLENVEKIGGIPDVE